MSVIATRVFGLKTPIIREGDDLIQISMNTLQEAVKAGVKLQNRDVLGITEAVVGRAQGNYATVDDVARAIREKYPRGTVGVLFPILSRNRFAMVLKGISRGAEKVVVQLSIPSDEVGNELFDTSTFPPVNDAGADIDWTGNYSEKEFYHAFRNCLVQGKFKHVFTGLDYIQYYKSLGDNIEVILSNNPRHILTKTHQVIVANIHDRFKTEKALTTCPSAGGTGCPKPVITRLDQILNEPGEGRGHNEQYGVLGHNKATEERIKLFPRAGQEFVDTLQKRIREEFGVTVGVLIFGDGGFKCPRGRIWELADPVVSPAYTSDLKGSPNEIKLKYVADSKYGHLSGEEQRKAIIAEIKNKESNLVGQMVAEGTTPRMISDLLGSLCDLTCGSGDKGTPLVLIQGYFDNYATETTVGKDSKS